MKKLLLGILLLIMPSFAYATTEISTAGTNLGIGTTDVSNALAIANTLAIGGHSYTSVTAPTNGAIIQGNVGIGSSNPGANIDVVGTERISGHITVEGVTSTGATGTGNIAFSNSPTFVTPTLGVANATKLTTTGNIGIGTTLNVNALDIATGGVSIGTTYAGYDVAPANGIAVSGNVGIGTWLPVYALQVPAAAQLGQAVVTVTQSATPVIPQTNSNGIIYSITGLAQAITSMTSGLSGTPADGQQIEIRITDNGTARAITWGASFESTTVTLPTTTVISTMLRIMLEYNSAASKWDCVGVA